MKKQDEQTESNLVRIWEQLKDAHRVHPFGLGVLFFQYLKSGLLGNPMGSLATLLLLLLAVLLAGVFFIISSPLTALIVGQGAHVPVKVYFSAEAESEKPPGPATRILEMVQEMPEVQKAEFVSGAQALQELQRELGEGHPLFRSLGEGDPEGQANAAQNILPDRLHLYPKEGTKQDELARLLEVKFGSDSFVREIRFESKIVATLRECSQLVFRLGTLLAVGIFSAAFLLVVVSMQLRYLLRAEEVGVMRLVGATYSFIVAPLYLEAALLGLFAGVFGLVVVRFFQMSVFHEVLLVFPHLAGQKSALSLGSFALLALVVAPFVIAIFGTWLATRLLRIER